MQLVKGEALKNPINKLFKSEREHKETSNHNVLLEVAQISDVQFTERSSVLKQKWHRTQKQVLPFIHCNIQ